MRCAARRCGRSGTLPLRRLASLPGFAETLEQFLIGVGPVSSETDLDALIASLAPETCRLAAHTAALRGDFEEAQRLAERAAALYASMRPRFPTLESVAFAGAGRVRTARIARSGGACGRAVAARRSRNCR